MIALLLPTNCLRNRTKLKVSRVTLVACHKGLEKQRRPSSDCFWRSSLIRVFPICYSDKHFVHSSPVNQYIIWEQKEKSVQNFRMFTKCLYSKTCVKGPLTKRPQFGFQDQLSLNAGLKYCRMLQGEHSVLLPTFIKLPFVIKIFVLSIFEWPFYTGFTVITHA